MQHIGLIMVGAVAEELAGRHLTYEEMLMRFVRNGNNNVFFTSFYPIEGSFPKDPTECDGWIISGSRHGVYEEHAWIAPLEEFCRAACQKSRVLGICFGHQLLAKAMGGKVERFSEGWGAGLCGYTTLEDSKWLPANKKLQVNSMHRDQVIVPPKGARNTMTNSHCKYACLEYDNWGLSFQCHPEFEKDYEQDLIKHLCKQELMPEDVANKASASLTGKNDNQLFSETVARFFAS